MRIPFLSGLLTRATGKGTRVIVCFRGNVAVFVRVNRVGNQAKVVSYVVRQLSGRTGAELARVSASLGLNGFEFSTLLENGEYQILTVDAPNVPAEEAKAAIRWRIKDSLNYPVEEATIDVLQIPLTRQGVDKAQSVYAIVARNEDIKKRMALFENAKLDLKIIDIPELAQRNIAALFEDPGRGLAVLGFDETGGILTFTGDGELYLARRIEISLGQLQDADDRLRHQSIDRLELELQRSLDSFDRNFNHLSVKRLLVTVPADMDLVARLSGNLGVPVERLDLSQVIDISEITELASDEAQVDAFYAIGAALRQEGAVP